MSVNLLFSMMVTCMILSYSNFIYYSSTEYAPVTSDKLMFVECDMYVCKEVYK